MYDISNGYRFRFVCFLFSLFLAGPALAQTATINGYSTNETGAICEDLESVLKKYDAYYQQNARPANWATFEWHRLAPTLGTPPVYKGYRTGTLADGTPVGGNTTGNIYSRNFNKCSVPNPCFAKKGTTTEEKTLSTDVSSALFTQMMQAPSGQTFETCYNGCKATGTFSFGEGAAEIGYSVVTNNNKYTGYMCQTSATADVSSTTPTPEKLPTEGGSAEPHTCPAYQCPGQVNGVDVCMPCDRLHTKDETQNSTTSSQTSASGETTTNGSNSSSTSTTSCDATTGNCTTTTTTTTTNSDGSSSTKTSTDTESKDNYCQNNPWDTKQCGGDEGDECEESDLLKCMKPGEPGEAGDPQSATASVSYSSNQAINMPTGCPAPKTFTYFDRTYNIEFTQLCVAAEKARPFVLLLAAAFASIIVVLGLRK